MKHKSMLYIAFVLLVGLGLLWGCPKKTETSASQETQATKSGGPGGQTQTMKSEGQEAKAEGADEAAGMTTKGLKAIHFDYDKSIIREDAKAVMTANAKWLKANPKAKVKIEGNCDERGTKEYNLALGQRRAASAKKYLTDMGVSGRRISLISYGKEKPTCTESNETCWQKNRRDDFVAEGE
jgi:peptidoglycan-associated lipoprotein